MDYQGSEQSGKEISLVYIYILKKNLACDSIGGRGGGIQLLYLAIIKTGEF